MAIDKKKVLTIDQETAERSNETGLGQAQVSAKPRQLPQAAAQKSSKLAINWRACFKRRSTIVGLVIVVLLIGLVSWSVLEKQRRDQQKQAEQAEQRAQQQAIDRAEQARSGELDSQEQQACAGRTGQGLDRCLSDKRVAKIDAVLQADQQKLPAHHINALLQEKIMAIVNQQGTNSAEALGQLAQQADQYQADHVTYYMIADNYLILGQKAKALEMFKISLRRHKELVQSGKDTDLDVYDYGEVIGRLEQELKK